MKTKSTSPNSPPTWAPPSWPRLFGSILVKDLQEGIKNKNVIALVVSALMMVVFYHYMPNLSGRGDTLTLLIYDPGSSELTIQLDRNQAVRTYTYPSEERMRLALASGDVPELGLVFPADLDKQIAGTGPLQVPGILLYWVSDTDAQRLQYQAQSELSALAGRQVVVDISTPRLLPPPESNGLNVQANFGLLYVIVLTGLTAIPHMLIEEKQSRTLDMLLVSPASPLQVMIAKAAAGLVFTLFGCVFAILINANLILRWDLVLIATLLGTLLFVVLGLCLGLVVESRGQLSIFAWVLILPSLLPVFLTLMEELFPIWVVRLIQWVPSVSFFQLLRYAYSDPVPAWPALLRLGYLLLNLVLWIGFAAWLVRRQEQVNAGESSIWQLLVARIAPTRQPARLQPTAVVDIPLTLPADQPPQLKKTRSTAIAAPSGWRIITAVLVKDLREAIHNKLLLSILLGTGFILISSSLLPLLLELQSKPFLVAYDQGRSEVLRSLADQPDLRLSMVRSQADLATTIAQAPDVRLGLVIPDDFDARIASDDAIQLAGYYVHWASPAEIRKLTEFFSTRLAQDTTGKIQISTTGNALYPQAGNVGLNLMLNISLSFIVLTLGVTLVPLLLVEEVQNQTLDAVLVSPASLGQVAMGKALAGAVFCLAALAISVLFYDHLFIHWGVLLLAALLSTTFATALGLLIGSLSNNPTSVSLWAGPVLMIIIATSLLSGFSKNSWPTALTSVLPWLPGPLVMNMFNQAMVEFVESSKLWSGAAVLMVMSTAFFALTILRLRKLQHT